MERTRNGLWDKFAKKSLHSNHPSIRERLGRKKEQKSKESKKTGREDNGEQKCKIRIYEENAVKKTEKLGKIEKIW